MRPPSASMRGGRPAVGQAEAAFEQEGGHEARHHIGDAADPHRPPAPAAVRATTTSTPARAAGPTRRRALGRRRRTASCARARRARRPPAPPGARTASRSGRSRSATTGRSSARSACSRSRAGPGRRDRLGVAPDGCGRGYATEASTRWLDIAFEHARPRPRHRGRPAEQRRLTASDGSSDERTPSASSRVLDASPSRAPYADPGDDERSSDSAVERRRCRRGRRPRRRRRVVHAPRRDVEHPVVGRDRAGGLARGTARARRAAATAPRTGRRRRAP